MYPCDPISFNCMKIRGEASYYYAEIKEFVKDFCMFTGCVDFSFHTKSVENMIIL